jgi:hypothetical protein
MQILDPRLLQEVGDLKSTYLPSIINYQLSIKSSQLLAYCEDTP